MDKRDGTEKTNGDQKRWIELFQINTRIGIIIDNAFDRAKLEKNFRFCCSRAHFQPEQLMASSGGRTCDPWVA